MHVATKRYHWTTCILLITCLCCSTPHSAEPTRYGGSRLSSAPTLRSPATGSTLDNARSDGKDVLDWTFRWEDVPLADAYELHVSGGKAPPILHLFVERATYRTCLESKGLSQRTGWIWKVRGWRQGKPLTAWSQTRGFKLEPIGLDRSLGTRVYTQMTHGSPNQVEFNAARGRLRRQHVDGTQDWTSWPRNGDSAMAVRRGRIILYPSRRQFSLHGGALGIAAPLGDPNADLHLDAVPVDKNAFQPRSSYRRSGGASVVGAVSSGAISRSSGSSSNARSNPPRRPSVQAPTEKQKRALEAAKTAAAEAKKKSVQPMGPSTQGMELLRKLESDTPLQDLNFIHQMPTVLWDENPNSGVFYYLPKRYRLDWTQNASAEKGFGMRLQYDAGSESDRQVKITMRLSSGLSPQHLKACSMLIQTQWSSAKRVVKSIELRPYPLRSLPIAKLSVRQLSIPDDHINVQTFTDVGSPIQLTLNVDAVTKENLQLDLEEGLGLSGQVIFNPDPSIPSLAGQSIPGSQRLPATSTVNSGEKSAQQVVPIQVRLDDASVFGYPRWQAGQLWRNDTPYIVKLKRLHVLTTVNRQSTVRSWVLGGPTQDVSSGKTVLIDDHWVPYWFDAGTPMWVEYEIAEGTADIRSRIFREITNGVDSLATQTLTLRSLFPLRDTDAHQLRVYVRSRYFHPQRRQMQTLPPLLVSQDEKVHEIRAIHLENRQPGEFIKGDPLAQYRIDAVLEDGEVVRSTRWHDVQDLEVIIGSKQVDQVLAGSH